MKNVVLVNKSILLSAVVLLVLLSGCGGATKFGVNKITTGAEQSVDILIPEPENQTGAANLELKFLAGQLTISPGAETGLATGQAKFNADALAPDLETNESGYRLFHGGLEGEGLPSFNKDLKNEWDIQLADSPLNLNIHAGAYTGRMELGGLSIQSLTIDEAGSDLIGAFSEPNHVEMKAFNLTTGGSTMKLQGLANANFETMRLDSGAGEYTLSFDGALQRDAQVEIETGASTVTIIVPPGVNASVQFDGGLSSVVPAGEWVKNDQSYTNSGSGPAITIHVKMGLGTLNLMNQ